jgi:hypothetical protein
MAAAAALLHKLHDAAAVEEEGSHGVQNLLLLLYTPSP